MTTLETVRAATSLGTEIKTPNQQKEMLEILSLETPAGRNKQVNILSL